MKALIVVGVIVAAIYGIAHANSSSSSSTDTASATSSPSVSVVASRSSCIASGISDLYTGDGKVMFVFTLRNTGPAGNVNVTPVRHYSDGDLNDSAMDMMDDVQVPGYASKVYRSEEMTYKAHEHEVISCGLQVNSGDEVPIDVAR